MNKEKLIKYLTEKLEYTKEQYAMFTEHYPPQTIRRAENMGKIEILEHLISELIHGGEFDE